MSSVSCVLLALLLCGCGSIEKKVDGYYTRPFCYPKLKFHRDKREYYAGVSCKY